MSGTDPVSVSGQHGGDGLAQVLGLGDVDDLAQVDKGRHAGVAVDDDGDVGGGHLGRPRVVKGPHTQL